MSEAVHSDQNVLLKQDWTKMISDVVRENQHQLVNFAAAGVAFALREYPVLPDCSEDERKEAWSTFFSMDPCYTTTLLFARESKVIDFYGIFAGPGAEAVKWQEFFRRQFIAVCEVCLEHKIRHEKSTGLSAALIRISLQEWRDAIDLDLSSGGLSMVPVNVAAGVKFSGARSFRTTKMKQ